MTKTAMTMLEGSLAWCAYCDESFWDNAGHGVCDACVAIGNHNGEPNQPLDAELNAAIVHICDKLFPNGFDVSDNAPSTYEALVDQYGHKGRMVVWNGASDTSIFADERVNYAFRAWHDHHHVVWELPFDAEGESDALNQQLIDLLEHFRGAPKETIARWKAILVAEVDGQFEYCQRHGGFPRNQRAFVEAYLVNKRDAVNRVY